MALEQSHVALNTLQAGRIPSAPRDEPPTTAQAPGSLHGQSLVRAAVLIGALAGTTTVSSMTSGLLTIALPRMAEDLALAHGLLLWPAAVYGLTSGCTLLLAGAVADAVGSSAVYKIGSFSLGFCILGSGFSKTGAQLIAFRGLQGVAISLCLPTATGILTEAFPKGPRRNAGFAFVGAGNPFGYSLGLLLGGVFVDSVGWKWGWYMAAVMALLVFCAGAWVIPRTPRGARLSWSGLARQVDWLGVFLASACLGMFSYVLAAVSGSAASVRAPANVAVLCLAGATIPTFIYWMRHQERRGNPALIPNSIWRSKAFAATCIVVFFSWAAVQVNGYFVSLFFQRVQGLPALQASLRLLPDVVIGIILSIVTGLVIHKYSAYWIVLACLILNVGSPLLCALANPDWPYWYALFWGVLLSAVAVDVLFIVSGLVISNVFPDGTQSLAGAVANTVRQFAIAVGLSLSAVISSTVTEASHYPTKTSPEALLAGYRASFYMCLGFMLLACATAMFGLREIGKIGIKRE